MPKHGGPSTAPPPTIPNLTGSDASDKAAVDALVAQLEGLRKRRAIVYWTSPIAKIHEGTLIPLYDQLMKIGKQPQLDLVLWSMGGDTDAPWPIVTLLREFTDELSILLPHRAQSAGTLLALGANEIVMTPLSVLGPIDPTRGHHLLPSKPGSPESEAVSVQDMRHAMEFVRSAFGSETPVTSDAMATIISALFEKVHPLAIGALEQTYALARLIAKQCLSTHMDATKDAAKIEEIAKRLSDDYKSHTYEIGRREAERLGLPVKNATPDEDAALMALWRFYSARPALPNPPPAPGVTFPAAIAWLDSPRLHQRVVANYQLEKDQKLKYLNDSWIDY
jgi:serine dehydrogenase proteinase